VAAFATPVELETFLQRTVDNASAMLALENASQQIRDDVGWSITQESATVATLDGTGERSLWLPTLQLTGVASVVEDGTTLTVVTDFDWTSYGRLIREGYWIDKPRSVVVTYTHGYPAGSEKLRTAKSVCLALAGQILLNPAAVRQQSIDDFSQTFAGSSADFGPLLGDTQRAMLALYRLPVG